MSPKSQGQSPRSGHTSKVGKIPVTNLYTAGIAGEAFLRALKERGEILGSPCGACGIVYVPARLFCERCFAELKEQRPVGPEGVVESFTVCGDQTALLVRLDGAGTLLMHRLLGTPVAIGARVRAELLPRAKRTGSILDIRGFKGL